MSSSVARPTRNRRLWDLFKSYPRLFILGAVCLVVTNILALRIPRELGRAIQVLRDADLGLVDPSSVTSQVATYAIIIIALAVGSAAARILSRVMVFSAGRHIEYDLRNTLLSHMSRLSPAYYQSIATGDLTSRVINDTTYVRLLFGVGYLHAINTVVAVVLALGLMFQLDWRLTFFCLIPYPIFLVVVLRLARLLHHYTRSVQEKLAEISAQCQEDLSGVAVMKSYAIESVEANRFSVQSDEYVELNMKLSWIRGTLFPLMMSLGSVGTLLVLYLGGRAVIVSQTISLGQFIEFSGYVALLAWPFMAMGWVISVWQRGTAAFDRIVEVLAKEPDIVAPDPEHVATRIESGRIEFRDVSFRYDDDGPEVLRDIDLTIEPGTRVGIVGRSGCGKTTLVDLMVRLHDSTQGDVLIDGKPISSIPLDRLRNAISYAPQEPFLFSTTIEKNIRFGVDARQTFGEPTAMEEEGIDDAVLESVVEVVQLGRDLETFPNGLETMVGERGITLSGGQKQRTALARALLMNPSILILDDSLSSVDTQTERAILDHLESAMAGRTAVVVTHRFSVLELMDDIVVMERGRIVEQGTHIELLKIKDGKYAGMVRRQKLQEEFAAL